MNVTNNENGLVPLHVSESEMNALLDLYMEQTNDLRTIKNIIYNLLTKLGFINDRGEIREVMNMKMLTDVIMKATMQNKKFKEEMAFLADALPLIEKYKDL